jgi:hypothetical protein
VVSIVYDSSLKLPENGCEKYKGGCLVAPMDDTARHQLHEILRALAAQLCGVSKETIALSQRERTGDVLSGDDRTRRTSNRELMRQIEDLITKTSKDIALERL